MVGAGLEGPKGLFLCCNYLYFVLCPNKPMGFHSGVSTAASQRQGPRFDSRLGSLSVWSLHILPVSAWVSSHSPKDVRVRVNWPVLNSPSVLPEQAPECGDSGIFTVTSLQCQCKPTCDE